MTDEVKIETPADTAAILEELGRPFTKTELRERKQLIQAGKLVCIAPDEMPTGGEPEEPEGDQPEGEPEEPEGDQPEGGPATQGELFE